jgi:CBS domain-containing protein
MRVHEIMTAGAKLVDPSISIRDAARAMRSNNVGALPVGENGRLIGMVTDRDIVVRAVADNRSARTTTVRQVMSGEAYYCFVDDDVERAAQIMAEHQVRRLPVLDHATHLVGMIALADLSRCAADAGTKALNRISQPSDQLRH